MWSAPCGPPAWLTARRSVAWAGRWRSSRHKPADVDGSPCRSVASAASSGVPRLPLRMPRPAE
eukprot:11159347-Alexandrium_andersonii.AAC.1